MTFSRANPLGWGLFEVLTSAQMNTVDINQSRAVDGFDGGTYNPSAKLAFNTRVEITGDAAISGGDALSVTGADTGIAVLGFGGPNDGIGVYGEGGATNGEGGIFQGTGSGKGVEATGGSSSGKGLRAAGGDPNGIGIDAVGKGTGAGIEAIGGNVDAPGINATGGNTNGDGILSQGAGTGAGVKGTGGSNSGSGIEGIGSGNSGIGVKGTGGTNGTGLVGIGNGGSDGAVLIAGATGANVRLDGRSGDPGTPNDGDVWHSNQAATLGLYTHLDSLTFALIPTWAMVNISGGATPVLRSFNVGGSAIVAGSPDVLRLTFTRAFVSGNYSATATFRATGGTVDVITMIWAQATTHVDIAFYDVSSAAFINLAATTLGVNLQVQGHF